MLEFNEGECKDLQVSGTREWLIVNGTGGYASSTVAGMNTRRYHGLLVAATAPPLGRLVLLSQLEDVIVLDGQRFPLSTNLYAGNVVHPTGYLNLIDFRLDPFPCFTYAQDDWQLKKSVFMIHGENSTVVDYRFTSTNSSRKAQIEVRPLIAFRDYHGTTRENDALDPTVAQEAGCIALRPYPGMPTCYLAHDPAVVEVDGHWYRNFQYDEEARRGLDCHEDLFSPLVMKATLGASSSFSLIASTEPHSAADVPTYRCNEAKRCGLAHYNKWAKYGRSELIPILEAAADQFIVTRAPRHTVLAGYHWFGEWGRDTMIALPGLLLATDRPELALEILLEFVRFVDGGMLPNRFPDYGEVPEYNTVDATLWFFEAIRQYFHYRKDNGWRDTALNVIRESLYLPLKGIVAAHLSGTRYGIHVDQNGFLWAGDATTNLTWMDAKVGDLAITPRFGRPVEIQALWFNALRTMQEFGRLLDDRAGSEECGCWADRLQANFESVFWNEGVDYLNDVARESEVDTSLRPNQIFAISLHHNLLGGDHARKVLDLIERELLTPYGLRTLSSNDQQYRGQYVGDVWSRDSAYHQGTVWPWLAGSFFSAKLKLADSYTVTLSEIEEWLTGIGRHLRDAGIGQISEIFDGDYPHSPRGCIAQAWSVSEILRLAKVVMNHPARRR
jgi:predicted glycogen debranching enzyme